MCTRFRPARLVPRVRRLASRCRCRRCCRHCPADYGFDPLRLGSKDATVLKYYREGELMNGRWAMAAVAGACVRACGPGRAGRRVDVV